MTIKKNIIIVLCNILLIVLCIFTAEVLVWACENLRVKKFEVYYYKLPIQFHPKSKYFYFDEKMFNEPGMHRYIGRNPVGTEYKRRPAVVFGCSFAHGLELKDEQTIDTKISEKYHLPVFNRAGEGFGIQHMLYQTRTPELYETIKDPEYVIYIFIKDHFRRLYSPASWSQKLLLRDFDLRYKLKNNRLVEIKEPPFYIKPFSESYIKLRTQNYIVNNVILKPGNHKTYFDFATEHFKEAKEEMQKHWSNAKFIILVYSHFDGDEEFAESLEKIGYKVIFTSQYLNEDIENEKYMQANGHPTEEAWDKISDGLSDIIKK